jgi:hypothetical protein
VTDVGPLITLPLLTLNFARQEIGTEEAPRGSNAGPRVEQYQATCHAKAGDAWCACFACWCVDQAAKALGTKPHLRYSAGALHLLEINQDLVIPAPEVGCLVVWRHANGLGHVGLVETLGDGTMGTIEGNTNPEGGREGYCVCRHTRPTEDQTIAGYVWVA